MTNLGDKYPLWLDFNLSLKDNEWKSNHNHKFPKWVGLNLDIMLPITKSAEWLQLRLTGGVASTVSQDPNPRYYQGQE